MNYVSTRGAGAVSFREALLHGLAPDGGLYVPEAWPRLSREALGALAGRDYTDVAAEVIAPFIGDALTTDELREIVRGAYSAFSNALVAPLVQIGPNDFLLELFYGPTLAFKDVALQLLGRLFEHELKRSHREVTIVCATSGDTGSAAIEAVRGRAKMRIVVLYPHGRISNVQRRQMTTAAEGNVHVLAVDGTFDDCQRIVKELFADEAFARRVSLSGVNSINWARIVAQSVYYVTSALALGAPEREISFVVPTGNFGDIYAGYVAHRIGLPVKRLAAATNANDILVRALSSGRYEKRGVVPTSSPSMDIEVASNFERLVFEALGRNAEETRALFEGLRRNGAFDLPSRPRGQMARLFAAVRAEEAEALDAIGRTYAATGRLIDPHTGVGVAGLATLRQAGVIGREDAAVVLATAHPAKFPEAVERATGARPQLPAAFQDLMQRPEQVVRVGADASAVKGIILAAR